VEGFDSTIKGLILICQSLNHTVGRPVGVVMTCTVQGSVIGVVEGMYSWPASRGGNDMYCTGISDRGSGGDVQLAGQ
jgi:hypothetical protein